jgi:hypothetical protein
MYFVSNYWDEFGKLLNIPLCYWLLLNLHIGEKKLKNWKNKQKISAISLILMLTIVSMFATLPSVFAHDPAWDVPTWCYLSVASPNPIGVNQEIVVVFWINSVPPTAHGAYGDRWQFNVEITTPSGTETTIGPFTSDPVGGGWATYTPTEVGTYIIVAKFLEHTITGLPVRADGTINNEATVGDVYLASSSEPYILTVQEDTVQAWSETPVTDDYWERPINSMNRNWWQLAGNWLGSSWQTNGPTSDFSWGKAPESAHVLWATPMWSGGIMDGRFGNTGYQTAHYEGISLTPPLVVDGKLYYNVQSLPREGWYCLDLYTGEELYFRNTTGPVTSVGGGFDASGELAIGKLAYGQIYNYESPNQHGGFPYLWSTSGPAGTWQMYDAYSGSYICSIKNAPMWAGSASFFFVGGTAVYGKDGSLTWYNLANLGTMTNPDYYIQCWNTSRAIWYEETWLSNEYWMWRPVLNMTYDGNNGYTLNASISAPVQGSLLSVREGDCAIIGTAGKNNDTFVQDGHLWAISLEQGKEGTLLWDVTFTPPQSVPDIASGTFGIGGMGGPTVDPEDGVFLFSESITRQWWCYDLETGEMLWGPSDPESSGNFYGMYSNIYDGKLLSCGYGGELVAYEIRTGDVEWKYTASQEGWESPYGNYPIGITCIADGKIYLTSSEHSPTQPLWRGSYIRCIDAETGEELWKINNWGAGMGPGDGAVIADGYLLSLNLYDNRIYCYGKGPSETAVTGPDTSIPLGNPVLLKGTVTDQSPGAKDTPAMSDEDMSAWMEYMYMQQPMPTNAQGVKVKLTAIDPNNNWQDIGEATADSAGNFGISWVPPVPGTYFVTATFEGSASYGNSFDTTYFVVDEAPNAAQAMEPEPVTLASAELAPTAEMPSITTEVAIIAAVAAICAIGIALLVLRKRK